VDQQDSVLVVNEQHPGGHPGRCEAIGVRTHATETTATVTRGGDAWRGP
jgi:hypothetical protein